MVSRTSCTINGDNFVAGNVVQFKWGVGAGAGVWNTGNAPSISSSSLLTVNMNPGTVNDSIYVRVCRSAAQTTDSDCSSGVQTVTVTVPLSNPFIRVSDVVVGEGAGYAEFVVRDRTGAQTVSVGYYTTGGTALTNDFVDVGTTALVFAPGETLKTVPIGIREDSSVEYTEFFRLTLSSPANATLGAAGALATIIDNDATAGTPVIRISDPVVDEAVREATFVLSLDRPGAARVSVDYATAAGSAGGSDFTATSGTAQFAPGEMR